MMKPTPTACMATSFGTPKRLQAIGIRSKDPPATPEAPAALKAASTQRMIDVRKSTWIPSVCAVDNAITEIVIAAPAMLIVAPRGMEIEYVSSSSPSFLQSSMFTGMLAAELLVKNAVMKLPFKQVNTNGKGFCFVKINTMIGLMMKMTTAILPTRTRISFP